MIKLTAVEKRYGSVLEALEEISTRASYFMNRILKDGHSDDKRKVISLLKIITYSFVSFSNKLEEYKDLFPEFEEGIEKVKNHCNGISSLTDSTLSLNIERVRSKLFAIQQEANKLYDEINAYAEEL